LRQLVESGAQAIRDGTFSDGPAAGRMIPRKRSSRQRVEVGRSHCRDLVGNGLEGQGGASRRHGGTARLRQPEGPGHDALEIADLGDLEQRLAVRGH
jgi:hypothetical protein